MTKLTSPFAVDRLMLVPGDVDLSRSPLAGQLGRETYVLGAFNPGLTRLPNGNLLMMARIAEALHEPFDQTHAYVIRWEANGYRLDRWPLDRVDTSDPRTLKIRGGGWQVLALTSLSWLLPVELSPDGLERIAIHYNQAIAPTGDWQCYGVEDARISKVGGEYLMTSCSVSPQRQSTTLYRSANCLDWQFADVVLDHQNKDMLIFEGLIDGHYWAQTRPLGDAYFAYPPESDWRAGPSINLATSPDALHWKPHRNPGIRPRADAGVSRIGGGAPPILTDEGWLTLWHGVEPRGEIGVYRTYWSLLDRGDPSIVLREGQGPLIEANPALTDPLAAHMYLSDVVFTTGIVDASDCGGGDHYIVASGEADLACRITHVPKARFA
jgi:predicted GH43/DUF377 family glycosyl hydrolase